VFSDKKVVKKYLHPNGMQVCASASHAKCLTHSNSRGKSRGSASQPFMFPSPFFSA
jgi:hypothetical protein